MEAAPPRAAATPTASSLAWDCSTSSATPASPTAAVTILLAVRRSPIQREAITATSKGWTAPMVAATPPGSRWAATKSSAKNTPMFSAPRRDAFHHQEPCGSRRVARNRRSPAGSARMAAARNGLSGGKSSVVTAYVVPQVSGAKAVTVRMTHLLLST